MFAPFQDSPQHTKVLVYIYVFIFRFFKIRLFGGNNKQEGYVEIWDERGWGAVCAEDWGLEEAIVTCRQLNLGYAREATRGNYFRPSRSKIRYSNVECKVRFMLN